MQRPAARVTLALLAGVSAACAAAAPPPSNTVPGTVPWLATAGTTTLGFGILRLAPAPGAAKSRFEIEFSDYGDGGYSSDATSAALIVLPGDVFAASDAAYADSWRAFARAEGAGGSIAATAGLEVERDETVLVAYGPWDGADVGRPPSDRHTFTLSVRSPDGGRWRWVESEAGELVTTNWTRRPGVRRGGPAADPRTGEAAWIETRVLVLYDPKFGRAAGASPGSEEEREKVPLTPALYAALREVPLRWR